MDTTYEFPLAHTYLPNIQCMYENLKAFKSTPVYNKFYLSGYYSSHKSFLPPKFRRSFVYLSSTESYFDIDGLTDHFTEHIRHSSRKSYSKSVYDCWNDPVCRQKIIQDYLNSNDLTPKGLRDAIYKNTSEPGLFRLTWCKGLFELIFGSTVHTHKHVLDISSGWGDRLICSISMGYSYLGFDPNLNLKSGHDNIIRQFGNADLHQIQYIPFEDAVIPHNKFDIVLTSPPFFDLEIYSDDQTQSISRYPQLDQWITHFLFVSIDKAWLSLKSNGYLAIHMADTYHHHVCERMNKHIQTFPNSSWEGVIGLETSKNKVYPVWVWKKN